MVHLLLFFKEKQISETWSLQKPFYNLEEYNQKNAFTNIFFLLFEKIGFLKYLLNHIYLGYTSKNW